MRIKRLLIKLFLSIFSEKKILEAYSGLVHGRRLNCIILQLVLKLFPRLVLHVQEVFLIPPILVHQETMYKEQLNQRRTLP
jgi:hypothetical protein